MLGLRPWMILIVAFLGFLAFVVAVVAIALGGDASGQVVVRLVALVVGALR